MKATRELAYGILLQGNQVRIQIFLKRRINATKACIYKKPMILTCAFNLSLFFYAYTTTGRILDFSNANTAVDQYHRFKVNYIDTFVRSKLHF
jgi:hypothetical protein